MKVLSSARRFSISAYGSGDWIVNTAKGLVNSNKVFLYQDPSTINFDTMTEFQIQRYNPESGRPLHTASYWIDHKQCGPMMLDAILKIKNEIDPSLSLRRSCREGICGSCAMNINGSNTLACLCALQPRGQNHIGPLVRMPILRDLVVDMSNFYKQYEYIEPFLKRKTPKAPGQKEYFQSKEDRALLDGLYECVLCASCSTYCPSYWWNQGQFLGPSVLMQAYRWVIDSRDEYSDERLEKLSGDFKLKKCYGIGACTATCPKGLNPRDNIAKLKTLYDDYARRKIDWRS